MKKLLLTLSCILSITLSSCYSTNKSVSTYSSGYSGQSYYDKEIEGKSEVTETIDTRKILYSAYLSLAVVQVDSANASIAIIAERYKGYVSETGMGRAVIKIESQHLEEAIGDISILGDLKRKDISSQDVTEEYVDTEIRLDNAIKSRDRYLELLAKAENVEAALAVEKELERLNEIIERFKGRLGMIDQLSIYSTITIELKEKKKLGVLGYVGKGLYHSVKWLFVRN